MRLDFHNAPEVLTVAEAATLLRVNQTNILDSLAGNQLPGLEVAKGDWRLSRDRLMALLDVSTSASRDDNKVGAFVQKSFDRLLAKGQLPVEELHRLQNATYCKKTFGVNYPVLRIFDRSLPLAQQRVVKSYPRYWSKVFGGKYLVTSEWYERHRKPFAAWVDTVSHDEEG
ncbi:MAG: hypothetical protein ACNA71_09065 [Kiritimatiellia bacterium]